jgi:hypothetical protein
MSTSPFADSLRIFPRQPPAIKKTYLFGPFRLDAQDRNPVHRRRTAADWESQ